MTTLGTNQDVIRFLDSVCEPIRAKKLHLEIKEELLGHLDELVHENISDGMEEKEAIRLGIARMGKPEVIGKQFDHTHRPRTDWLMLALIVLLVGTGLLAMYTIQTFGMGASRFIDLFTNKMVHIGIGTVLMAVFWIVDYQRIKAYSEYLFGLGVVLLWLVSQAGLKGQGQLAWFALGGFSFYIPTISILLMIVGLAGIRSIAELDWKGCIRFIGYRGMLPIVLFVSINVYAMACLYSLLFFCYLWNTKRHAWQVLIYVVSGALLMTYALITQSSLISRKFGFLNRHDDPKGTDYFINRSLEAMQAAGWWGKGVLPRIFSYSSESFLPTFIYLFGWVAGAVVILLIIGFIGKTAMATTKIKDGYGNLLFAGIGLLFVIQFVWAVAMIFGYAPVVGISIPFLSYGGTDQIFQLAAMGLLLGIYRRKDMVPSQTSSSF